MTSNSKISPEASPSSLQACMSTNKILGVGGFGLVIAVYDKELKTDLAIKIITNTSKTKVLDSLKKEAEILESLDHKNIVGFKYFKQYHNCFLLAIEWCQEGSLLCWLKGKDEERLLILETIKNAEKEKSQVSITLTEKESEECCHHHCKNLDHCILKQFYKTHENE